MSKQYCTRCGCIFMSASCCSYDPDFAGVNVLYFSHNGDNGGQVDFHAKQELNEVFFQITQQWSDLKTGIGFTLNESEVDKLYHFLHQIKNGTKPKTKKGKK